MNANKLAQFVNGERRATTLATHRQNDPPDMPNTVTICDKTDGRATCTVGAPMVGARFLGADPGPPASAP